MEVEKVPKTMVPVKWKMGCVLEDDGDENWRDRKLVATDSVNHSQNGSFYLIELKRKVHATIGHLSGVIYSHNASPTRDLQSSCMSLRTAISMTMKNSYGITDRFDVEVVQITIDMALDFQLHVSN